MTSNKILKQSSNYFWGEALIMASGFISFPILTRILSKYDYGLLNLLALTTAIIGAITSLGANRSIIRFYHNYKDKGQLNNFVNTLVNSITGLGFLAVFIAISVGWMLFRYGIMSRMLFSG